MGDYGINICKARARHTKEILGYTEVVHAVNAKLSIENKIHHLAHLSGIAVFYGEHCTFTGTACNRLIGTVEVRIGDIYAVRKNIGGSYLGKCSFHTAVCHLYAFD